MSRANILIVEDDALLAMDLQTTMSRLDYAVAGIFATGEKVLAFLADKHIHVDLILMDIELAGAMNGIVTAEKIRQTADIPIIFLTGFSQDPMLKKALIAGPYGYLIKPVPERELAATLEMALHRHSLDRQLKESKMALEKSQQRLHLAQEAAHSGTWEWDLTTNENIWSDELWHLYGVPPNSIKASYENWLTLIHPDDRGHIAEIIERVTLAKSVLNLEWRVATADGTTQWLMSRGKPILADNGQVTSYLGIVIDITDRKRAEERLRNSEEKFRLTFDFSPDAININRLDDGLYVDCNQGFTHLTGYTRQEVIGRTSVELGIWQNAKDRQRLTKSLMEKGFVENLEATFCKKDGIRVTALMSARIISLHHEPHIVSITRDITEHKKIEAQLIQAQKMEAIGTLAGGIAHDFNNILGAILGYAELVQEDSRKDPQTTKNLGQILKAGNRAKDLVKQILTFSRQTEENKLPVQPILLVEETIKLLRSSLPTTIAIVKQLDPMSGFILADPTQMHQIIMNLCTNAFHAMEEHGGTLTISLQRTTVTAAELADSTASQPGKYVQLSIGDTGTGISEEVKKRIFDPYFTTKGHGKGTGLGLSITHGIVKSYGGFIVCHSQIGKGTTFEINLPSWEKEVLPVMQPLNVSPVVAGEHILLVDDESMLAELNKAMLERSGYTVTVHTSSQEAYTAFKNHPHAFDLVITDQTMPEMTGYELANKLLRIRADLPIILCTGYSSVISEEKATAAGIKGFALKPFTRKDINAYIRRILDEASSAS